MIESKRVAAKPKVALVTGASRGLGLTLSKFLAGQGYAVIMTARRADELASAAAEVRSRGGRAEPLAGDVADGGHRKRLLEPHREFLLERMAARPDMTISDLVGELAEHGIKTTPVTAWRMVRSAGLRFKKNAVRHRAATPEGRPKARAVEEVPGPA